MAGSRGAHRQYVPPRRLDQSPRYKGFSPREFMYTMVAVFVLVLSAFILPAFGIPWESTISVAMVVSFLIAIWPRKIRDAQWEEGQLIVIRLLRMKCKGRRFAA